MNESKHTPGPWDYWFDSLPSFSGVVVGPTDRSKVVAGVNYIRENNGYGDADAYLIAAAPELLEACKMAKAFGSHGETEDGICVAYLIEKAIAKAEGRSS